MPIRVVFVDFGGVLYFPPETRSLRRMQTLLGLKNDPDINRMFSEGDDSEYLHKIFTGEIPEAEIWDHVSKRWRVSPWLVNYLRKRSFSKKRFNQRLADFVQSLRPGIKTAVLSNAGDQARPMFCETYHIDNIFDKLIISAEVGLAKPDERIYRLALEHMNVTPEESVFIDDLAPNVEGARRIGMHAVHFLNTDQALRELKAIL
jgi:epoxide hydrolase-like predicted phosphatase